MRTLFFWETWSVDYRRIWYIVSAIFIISLFFMWFSWFRGANGVIHWEKLQEQKIIETTVHNFRLGPFDLAVPAESYVILEYLQGSDLEHNTGASYVFLFVLIFCAMVLLTIISTFNRFWYYAAMGVFIIFVVSLRLDVLLIFGLRGYVVPVSVLVLFVALSYYFKSISPATGFSTRLLAFLVLCAVLAILIVMFSEIQLPMLHLAVTAYSAALVLSLLFIIMVAHEILVSFIYITTQGNSKSLRHFSLISSIYMINIVITALHETGYLQWNFIYINAYLLLTVSALLGIWAFKLREPLYENFFSFSPLGAFFYTAFASICFISTAQLLANANDAALKIVRDVIIFSHAGFGIIFLTYFFANYAAMMARNIPVYKVLYKPARMPYFSFRFAGLIATLAFVFSVGWRQYIYHGLAGFYNYIGDLYILQNNETFGRSFYEQSRTLAFQNNRANYALATIKADRLDFEAAFYNYELANDKRPTDFSLINEGNLYLWRKEFFPAIRTFRQAEKIKPSGALSNNLGYAYAKVHAVDSAVFYISEARKDGIARASAETNFFAMAATEYIPVKTDSILEIFNTSAASAVGNAIAAATLFDQDFKKEVDPLADRSLNLYSATLLNNYIVRNAKVLDTAFTSNAFRIANDSLNFDYSEALKASLAYACYHQGNVYKALQVLGELSYITQSYQGKYNYIMGLWALDQENPGIALDYFTHSVEADYKQAKLYNAIALTEAGRTERALIAWDSVASRSSAEKEIATRIKNILTLTYTQALALGDEDKYQFCRYNVSLHDTTNFLRIVNTFHDANYKAQALLDMAKKNFRADRILPAIRFYNQVSGLKLTDKKLYEDIRYFELRMLASRKEVRKLANQINKGITFDSAHTLEKLLYAALISESGSDMTTAAKNYELLGRMNPFFEDGILAAADFFRNQDTKSHKPYDILAEAIQVNSYSIRLLKAYATEAARIGFDEYAASAVQRLILLEQSLY